jgi:hypothetical protein
MSRPRILAAGLFTLAFLLLASRASAQDLEPRRWTHLPVGLNTLAVGYGGQEADIFFNPLIGITDGTANVNAWLARYAYTFDWSGRMGRVDLILPYVSGSWQGLVDGEPGRRDIKAGSDPWLRLSWNFYGSPSLSREEFRQYLADNPVRTTVGASLAVSLPLGSYDPTELINVGRNRYTVRPQLGVLHTRGAWSFELSGSVFLFTDNTEFVDGITLSQEPVWAVQGHVTRNFGNRLWIGAGLAYAAGGKVDLDAERVAFEVDNLLWNVIGSYRITTNQSVVLGWQQGRTQVNVGTDTDTWLMSWVYAWGR